MKKQRLFGNVKDLEYIGSNSSCNYYKLTLWIKNSGYWFPYTETGGFLYYNKKEIFRILKGRMIDRLNNYGIEVI